MTGGVSNFGTTTGCDFSGGKTKLPLADGAGAGLEVGVADAAGAGVADDAATAFGFMVVCALTPMAQAATIRNQTQKETVFMSASDTNLGDLRSQVIRNSESVTRTKKNLAVSCTENEDLPAVANLPSL